MNINLDPGKYVVAVSGGVDSVALLDMLYHQNSISKNRPWKLVVAHFDHGIREDSASDKSFVEGLAERYGLLFVYAEGRLGPDASEATARCARYEFLHQVRETHSAQAVMTAHHQDDLLETVLLNLLRGTNRKGLSSLRSTDTITRPLLHVPKQQLIDYARARGLTWREDSTNADEKYQRNYIRRRLMPRLSADDRQRLLGIVSQTRTLNDAIDVLLAEQLQQRARQEVMDRDWFIGLPHSVAREIMATWLRRGETNVNSSMLERIVIAAKTKASGKQVDVQGRQVLAIEKHQLALVTRDR